VCRNSEFASVALVRSINVTDTNQLLAVWCMFASLEPGELPISAFNLMPINADHRIAADDMLPHDGIRSPDPALENLLLCALCSEAGVLV
jgi:hypothetical protein